ncbi:maleylpyruvate isomerase family mycothiol-dependent enzyme [Phytoactinopolyspora endophytica]|uniref:maleylpyruvate isomerase family mycothiol-dependent enzyme n=1 Tax=Phytoactinopolyspora endophytica TaxID=1642495 RepID=UPI00101D5476|nr:maleylpyruvate isomerase family mycothiol-dependent enzyme [Phytoactinopolyspora endophytica]
MDQDQPIGLEESWLVIEQERRSLAELLDSLTEEEWQLPSLCVDWRIKDVAAHLALTPQPIGAWSTLVQALCARGSFNRFVHDVSVRHADRPAAEIVDELRVHAASRTLPALTNYRNILMDTLVHGQDIAIPLGRERPMPLQAATASATLIWRKGWPFWARRRLAGLRLVASDIDWTAGSGPELRGPISAHLLLVTGRTAAALPYISGDGLPSLTTRA